MGDRDRGIGGSWGPVLTKSIRRKTYYYPTRARRPRRLVKYVKQAMIAVLAFWVAAGIFNQIIPSPTIPGNIDFISPKYAHYQAHRDDYNTLFFGSSRIYSHVAPEVFDAVATEGSASEIKSFNFGIPALRAIPGYILLRDVLKDPPKNLKWVFIETPLDTGYEPLQNARTTRAIYWHTFANTKLAARYILNSDESMLRKAFLLGSHLLPCFYHQTNIGRLFDYWLPIHQFSAADQAMNRDFLAQEGYAPLIEEDELARQQFLAHLNRYDQSVEQLANRTAQGNSQVHIPAGKLDLIKEMVATVEAAGAHPIFVVPPTLEPQFELKRAHQLGHIPTLWAFNNPGQFPELYAFEQRYDEEHLNDRGARAFTRLLADTFLNTHLNTPQDKSVADGAMQRPERI